MLPDSLVGPEDESRPAGAPANEIEITPEMIEAGGAIIWSHLSHDPLMSPSFAETIAGEVLRRALMLC